MSLSVDRIASQIQKELAILLQQEVHDTQIKFITITDVRVTNDLSYAYIYFMGNESRIEESYEALKKAKGFLKNEIAKRVNMRKVPEFIFKEDNALKEGNKIEKLLKELK